MARIAGDPLLRLVLRAALGALFAAAALHKLRDLRAFAATLRNYRLLPNALAALAAAALVAAETAAAALLLGGDSRAGALAAAALLALYSAAIAVNLVRGRRDIDCGCLGPRHRQTLSEWLLVRNGAAAAAAATLLLPGAARALVWVDGVSLIAALLCLALLWESANRLMQTWPRLRPLRWVE